LSFSNIARVSKKKLRYSGTTARLFVIFGRDDQYSLANDCERKVWYGMRTTCVASIETVAPVHHCWIARGLSAHVQQRNASVMKHLALFYQKYGHLPVWTLTRSISLQDLGLYAGAHV